MKLVAKFECVVNNKKYKKGQEVKPGELPKGWAEEKISHRHTKKKHEETKDK